ncbi:hypothetical protein GCM10010530_21880 [Kribbella aluminosa]
MLGGQPCRRGTLPGQLDRIGDGHALTAVLQTIENPLYVVPVARSVHTASALGRIPAAASRTSSRCPGRWASTLVADYVITWCAAVRSGLT